MECWVCLCVASCMLGCTNRHEDGGEVGICMVCVEVCKYRVHALQHATLGMLRIFIS